MAEHDRTSRLCCFAICAFEYSMDIILILSNCNCQFETVPIVVSGGYGIEEKEHEMMNAGDDALVRH